MDRHVDQGKGLRREDRLRFFATLLASRLDMRTDARVDGMHDRSPGASRHDIGLAGAGSTAARCHSVRVHRAMAEVSERLAADPVCRGNPRVLDHASRGSSRGLGATSPISWKFACRLGRAAPDLPRASEPAPYPRSSPIAECGRPDACGWIRHLLDRLGSCFTGGPAYKAIGSRQQPENRIGVCPRPGPGPEGPPHGVLPGGHTLDDSGGS